MSERLTTQELAEFIPAPINTIRYWRHRGKGPKGYKVGRRVFYDRVDVEAWLRQQKQDSSS